MTLSELFNTQQDRELLYSAFVPVIPAPNDTPFGEWWYNYFAEREVVVDDKTRFYGFITRIHPIIAMKWLKLIQSYSDVLDDLIKASDERTVTQYSAPNGNPDTAYAVGMTREVFSDTTTDDDYARLTRVKEIRNYYFDLLNEYESLFIGVWAI